jgi:hypothetical protein
MAAVICALVSTGVDAQPPLSPRDALGMLKACTEPIIFTSRYWW